MRDLKKTLYWVWLTLCFPPACERMVDILDETDPVTFYRERPAYSFLRPGDYQVFNTVSLEQAQAVLDRCKALQVDILTMEDPEYPESLLHIYCPPPVLYVRGTLAPLQNRLSVAAVGTRKPSPYYASLVGNISYQLARAGAVVISGCAVGLDTMAHQGCIAGKGPTVAVLACGIDVNYPTASRELKERIVQTGGALVTELQPGMASPKGYFHYRNRLIAGLSDCVMLGQVPFRSGAMITANAAIDQGKEVFCIPPNNLYDGQCMGIADYIRDGARVIFSAYDIVVEYKAQYPDTLHLQQLEENTLLVAQPEATADMPAKKRKQSEQPAPVRPKPAETEKEPVPELGSISPPVVLREERLVAAAAPAYHVDSSDPRTKVLALLTDEPQLLDDLQKESGLSAAQLLQILTNLELEGLVEAMSGSRYRMS
jgi:DNA processing protein